MSVKICKRIGLLVVFCQDTVAWVRFLVRVSRLQKDEKIEGQTGSLGESRVQENVFNLQKISSPFLFYLETNCCYYFHTSGHWMCFSGCVFHQLRRINEANSIAPRNLLIWQAIHPVVRVAASMLSKEQCI